MPPIPHPTYSHPDVQIETITFNMSCLERGLCPYCERGQPTAELRKLGIQSIVARNKVVILYKRYRGIIDPSTLTGYSFKCPLHGVSGCSNALVLCFTEPRVEHT